MPAARCGECGRESHSERGDNGPHVITHAARCLEGNPRLRAAVTALGGGEHALGEDDEMVITVTLEQAERLVAREREAWLAGYEAALRRYPAWPRSSTPRDVAEDAYAHGPGRER